MSNDKATIIVGREHKNGRMMVQLAPTGPLKLGGKGSRVFFETEAGVQQELTIVVEVKDLQYPSLNLSSDINCTFDVTKKLVIPSNDEPKWEWVVNIKTIPSETNTDIDPTSEETTVNVTVGEEKPGIER